ncbi:MAG TPA: FtsQ-type POTRA domain-containing protein [Candidatus Polarisedimenticolia bacterium]|nr:FtsQ-type POTRA domain-containing protein [Candidatus Polarisedimenticolia bacterium]
MKRLAEAKRLPVAEPMPFLRRAQSEQVRRSRRGRALRRRLVGIGALFGVGLLAGGVYVGRLYVTRSSRFALRHVDISPTRHAPEADLRRVVERYRGRNLFLVDLARIERDLTACRWVRGVKAKRVLPDGIFCAVEERTPRALALLRGRVWLIDGEGVPIDTYGEETKGYSFPIFAGIDERDQARAARQAARGAALLDDLDRHHPGLASEISEIDLSHDDRIDLHMNEGGPVVRLNPEAFGNNLDRYLAMRDYLTTNFGDGAYVDLRFRDRIAFQPLVAKGE